MEENKEGKYHIESIFLLESDFKRDPNFNPKDAEHNLEILTEFDENSADNRFGVSVVLEFTGHISGKKVFGIRVRMNGIFERQGEHPVSISNFKKINAPAIIYPFLREHVSSICTKAGIGQFLLPPVNFKLMR